MVEAIIGVFADVFTGFVKPLGTAVVNIFEALFVTTDGGITSLAEGLLTFAAIGMVIGALYLVYGIFRTRSKKSI